MSHLGTGTVLFIPKSGIGCKIQVRKTTSHQWEMILKIRGKLSEYNKAILEQSMMGQLAEPSPESLRSLQHWLERPKMGGSALIGKDKDSWGDASEPINPHHDLLSVVCNKETDKFSAWFSQNILRSIYHLIWLRVKSHKDLESGVLFYQNDTLQKFTSYFAIIVASLLPILAIAVLYSVESMKARLGLVALFIVIFASCLSIFTYAARSEIFIATST